MSSLFSKIRDEIATTDFWRECRLNPKTAIAAGTVLALSTFYILKRLTTTSHPYSWFGKTVVIVGASSGIGKAIALQLAHHKVNFVLAARREKELNETKHSCEGLGSNVAIVVGDIASPEICKSIVDTAINQYQAIDALFLVAGISMGALFDEVTNLEIYNRLMEVNYFSSVRILHHALPHLAKTKGKICAVTSGAAILPFFTRTGYCASKQAAYAFFESLRTEIKPKYDIDITLVTPTVTKDTNINHTRIGFDGELTKRGNFNPELGIKPSEAAQAIIQGVEEGKRLVHFGLFPASILRSLFPTWVEPMIQTKAAEFMMQTYTYPPPK